MRKFFGNKPVIFSLIIIIVTVLIILLLGRNKESGDDQEIIIAVTGTPDFTTLESIEKLARGPELARGAEQMPVYGNWKTFTEKDGLPSDKVYTVRIDGDRVLAGTHDGLAVYENGKWRTYTTKDGLGDNGVV